MGTLNSSNLSSPIGPFQTFFIKNFLLKVILAVVGICILGFFILVVLIYLTEPTASAKNIFITNLTDKKATVSWTTEIPTRGTLLISEKNRFSPIPLFGGKLYKDDGEKRTSKVAHYTTHHVTATSLQPGKRYYYRIYQGWKGQTTGEFVTLTPSKSITTPNPIYGRVLTADKKYPVVGALIYYQAQKGASQSAVLSTLTNLDGGWTLDVSSLKTRDYKADFRLTKGITETVIVDTGVGRVKSVINSGKNRPWVDILYGIEQK